MRKQQLKHRAQQSNTAVNDEIELPSVQFSVSFPSSFHRLNISHLPIDMLAVVVSYLLSRSDIFKLIRVNKALRDLMLSDDNSVLWRVLCKRDNFHNLAPLKTVGYRQMFMSFENDVGHSKSTWLLRFNLEKLCWECNQEVLAIINSLKRQQVSIITALDMDEEQECASHILNNLLGVKQAFPSREQQQLLDNNTTSPCLYAWCKPFIFHSQTHAFATSASTTTSSTTSTSSSSSASSSRRHGHQFGAARRQTTDEDNMEPQTKYVLFFRAYGLFDKENNDFHDLSHMKKTLISFIMLLSSTVIICKNQLNMKWVQQLDEVMETVNEPPLFGTLPDMRSLLICTKTFKQAEPESAAGDTSATKPLIQAYDALQDINECISQYKVPKERWLEDLPFSSCAVNWFGKIHGFYFNCINPTSPSNELPDTAESNLRSDLWAFMNDVTHVLKLGWPMSRWSRMKPYGDVVSKYIEHCVNETNKRHDGGSPVNVYDKIISKFGKEFLNQEMQLATEFYRRALQAELNKVHPLEMYELVKLSEMHAESALRTFNQSVSPALFHHQVIDELERHLTNGINNNFRPLWRENGQISENYCQQIFDSCFKWAKAECDCPSRPATEFKTTFATKFYQSLQVYIDNSKGTRKYQVMSFFSKQYIDIILQIYPEMKPICDKILIFVEHKTMQGTMEIDKERSYLQKISGMNLKLLSIENGILRLEEEINARAAQAGKSDAFQPFIEDKLHKIGVQTKNSKSWATVRNLFIDSAKIVLEQEIARYNEQAEQMRQLLGSLPSNPLIESLTKSLKKQKKKK